MKYAMLVLVIVLAAVIVYQNFIYEPPKQYGAANIHIHNEDMESTYIVFVPAGGYMNGTTFSGSPYDYTFTIGKDGHAVLYYGKIETEAHIKKLKN